MNDNSKLLIDIKIMLASSSTSLRLKGDEKALFRTEQKIVKNKCVVCPWLLIVYEVMKKKIVW